MSIQSTGDTPIKQYIDTLHSKHSKKFPFIRMRNTLRPHGIIGDEWLLDNICQCCYPRYQKTGDFLDQYICCINKLLEIFWPLY